MSEGKVGCSEKVHDAFGVGFHPCSRVGRVERDGKWYCSQHDPCYVKKRREQRQVENQQQLKHQRIYSQVDMDAALRRAKGEGLRLGAEMVEDDCYGGMYMFDDNDLKLSQVDQWKRTHNKNQCGLAFKIRARAAQIEEGG